MAVEDTGSTPYINPGTSIVSKGNIIGGSTGTHILESIYIETDKVKIDTDKVQSLQGIHIKYSGDIKINCNWCVRMHEFDINGKYIGRETNRDLWVLIASNISKQIIIFSMDMDVEKRTKYLTELNDGELFSFKNIGKSNFEIISTTCALSRKDAVTLGVKNATSNQWGRDLSLWAKLDTKWEDLHKVKSKVKLVKSPIKKKNITGWELKPFKEDKKEAIKSKGGNNGYR